MQEKTTRKAKSGAAAEKKAVKPKETVEKKATRAKEPAPKANGSLMETPGKKEIAGKIAGPKAASAKNPRAVKRAGSKPARGVRVPTEEEIAVAAYFRYEKRVALGVPADAKSDWEAALEELAVGG